MGVVLDDCQTFKSDNRRPRPHLPRIFGSLADCRSGPTAAAAWPGFAPDGANPVTALADKLEQVRRDAEKAQNLRTALESTQQSPSTTEASFISFGTRIDRQAWFAQYVVTTVGFANVTGTEDSFWVNYYGFKLYPWANRVDEPKALFVTGLHRLFALELAFVPNLKAFGPSTRFQGLSGGALPPLMTGLSFQPLPYLTASLGAIFMESRRTVLPQESAELFVRPYLAIAADVNILDIAAAALAKGRANTIGSVFAQ